jgi:hypothetical protein
MYLSALRRTKMIAVVLKLLWTFTLSFQDATSNTLKRLERKNASFSQRLIELALIASADVAPLSDQMYGVCSNIHRHSTPAHFELAPNRLTYREMMFTTIDDYCIIAPKRCASDFSGWRWWCLSMRPAAGRPFEEEARRRIERESGRRCCRLLVGSCERLWERGGMVVGRTIWDLRMDRLFLS